MIQRLRSKIELKKVKKSLVADGKGQTLWCKGKDKAYMPSYVMQHL